MTVNSTDSTKTSAGLTTAMREAWARKENRWAILIAIVGAYLSLFNLGYAPLWRDEPHMTSVAHNLLDSGEYTTWDGRNLVAAYDGRIVNQDLVAVSIPPWRAISTLVGIALFGYNETGVRFFHALLGVASLFVFWRLLQLDFASRPRLRVIAFALFALSAQSILFFRQGRYCADAIFFSLSLIYAYRLYISTGGRTWHLVCATGAALLGFFNQLLIGITTLLALAAWHLLFYRDGTTKRQWLSLIVAGIVFSTVCFGYLWLTGIFENRENLDLGDRAYHLPWLARGFVLTIPHFRDIVRFNWIPLWIAIWLLGWACWIVLARRRSNQQHEKDAKRPNWKNRLPSPEPEDIYLARYFMLFVMLLIFTAFISIQSPTANFFANSRYLVAALPFSFLLVAICVDWLWRRLGALPALSLLAVLMLSNLAGQPTSFKELRFTLPSLVQEIHRPLNNSMVEVTQYLQEHAKQDELIQVEPWPQRDILMIYLGDKLRFCCMINKETTPLPPKTMLSMGEHLYQGEVTPDWIVNFSKLQGDPKGYELSFTSKTHGHSSFHRAELEYHAFQSVEGDLSQRAYIYKKKS